MLEEYHADSVIYRDSRRQTIVGDSNEGVDRVQLQVNIHTYITHTHYLHPNLESSSMVHENKRNVGHYSKYSASEWERIALYRTHATTFTFMSRKLLVT